MPTRMPLEAIAAELAADPRFEVAKETHRTGVTEVRHPTCRERVHFAQHAVETDAVYTLPEEKVNVTMSDPTT